MLASVGGARKDDGGKSDWMGTLPGSFSRNNSFFSFRALMDFLIGSH